MVRKTSKMGLKLWCILLILATIYTVWDMHKHSKKEIPVEKLKKQEEDVEKYAISIPKLHLFHNIHKGNVDDLLEEKKIVQWKVPDSSNLYLVGHRIKEAFLPLTKLEVGDKIKLYWKSELLWYQVKKIMVVEETELPSLESKCDLVLITCMNDDTKRLLIVAENQLKTVENIDFTSN